MERTTQVWLIVCLFVFNIGVSAALQAQSSQVKSGQKRIATKPVDLLLHEVNEFGTWIIVSKLKPELPRSRTQLSLLFLSPDSEAVSASFDIKDRATEINLPSGSIRSRQLPKGRWVIKMVSRSGRHWTSVVDADGIPETEEYQRTMERGIAEVVEPSRQLLEFVELSAVASGILDPDEFSNGRTYNQAKLSETVHCIVSAAGWVASWGSIAACATGIGCIGAIALMTATSVTMADSCGRALNKIGE
jgi:hypothetical protein